MLMIGYLRQEVKALKRTNDAGIFILLISFIFVLACTHSSHALLIQSRPLSPEPGTRRVMPASYEETYAAFAWTLYLLPAQRH